TVRHPYPELEAKLQSDIGGAYASIEDYAQARDHFKAAVALPLGIHDRYWTLGSVVEAALHLGDFSDAQHHLQRMEALGDSAGLNPALVELTYGHLELAQSDPRAA